MGEKKDDVKKEEGEKKDDVKKEEDEEKMAVRSYRSLSLSLSYDMHCQEQAMRVGRCKPRIPQ